MKKAFCSITVYFFIQPFLFAQNPEDSIQEKEVSGTLNFLSSDALKGRGNFTPELVTAANYIADEFRSFGLQPFPGDFNFHLPFNASTAKDIYRDNIKWNEKKLDQSQFIYLSREILPSSKTLSDFNLIEYNGRFTDSIFFAHWLDTTNTLIWWKGNQSGNRDLPLENFRNPGFPPFRNILFVSENSSPSSLVVTINEQYRKNVLFDMIGVLPGKGKPKEIIIFSAHYDHIGSTEGPGDAILNGANDDASGTTALLMLAKYFSLRNDNERSIFFCAFAGEELGLIGSTFFSSMLKPQYVKAVINIEMIGKTNVAGNNSFFVTGANYSNLEKILKANLKNNVVKVSPGSEAGKLFQRSDNFPFALKGIPAHTIMCSDDNDPCYHKNCDEAQRIEIRNMTNIIKAIASATENLINGKDTPTRIKPWELK